MTPFEIVKRIRAYEARAALPRGKTLRTFMTEPADAMLVVFLRMGGSSAPWAIAWGNATGTMTCASTPDPRIARISRQPIIEFAPHLLKHLFHPAYKQPRGAFDPVEKPKNRIRQVWVPNSSHLEMFHQVAYRYLGTKEGDETEIGLLKSLGRASNFLFQEAQRPGQMMVQVATSALKDAFVIPADDVRQGHLGFLMAWLDKKVPAGKRAEAAAHAEETSISVSLDPQIEREILIDLLKKFSSALDGGGQDSAKAVDLQGQIHKILERECQKRFDLLKEAWNRLHIEKRPQNPGLELLVEKSNGELVWEYLNVEKKFEEGDKNPFVSSPETDYAPTAAAKRYLNHNFSEALRSKALAPHDDELLAEMFASGNAIRGKVIEVRNNGSGRKLEPIWVVSCTNTGPLRLREGSGLYLATDPAMAPEVVSITSQKDKSGSVSLVFELYFNDQKKRALLPSWKAKNVVLISDPGEKFLEYKMGLIWNQTGPGAWLTHQPVKRARS